MPRNTKDFFETLIALGQILFTDRAVKHRLKASLRACEFAREQHFHSRCKIKPLPWPNLFTELLVKDPGTVTMASPGTNFLGLEHTDFYHAIATVVKALQPRRVFEIGTYVGVNALTMAANTEGTVWTMDLPDDRTPDSVPELWQGDKDCIVKSRYKVGSAFAGLKHRIIQVRADSMTFNAVAQGYTDMDLVIVDGGHSMPLLTRDTANAFAMLAKDGAIIWDDYSHCYPHLVKYLDRLSDKYAMYGIPNTNYVIHSRRFEQ